MKKSYLPEKTMRLSIQKSLCCALVALPFLFAIPVFAEDIENEWGQDQMARQEFREEMEKIRAEHEDLEGEHDQLKIQCMNVKGQERTACNQKWQNFHQRKDALHERMHALHEKMAAAHGKKKHDQISQSAAGAAETAPNRQ